jgi:hypothetical protein
VKAGILLSQCWNYARMNETQSKRIAAGLVGGHGRTAGTGCRTRPFFFALLAVWLLLFQFWGNSILGYVHTPSLFGWLYYVYNIGARPPTTVTAISSRFWSSDFSGGSGKELLALPLKLWWPGLLMLARRRWCCTLPVFCCSSR